MRAALALIGLLTLAPSSPVTALSLGFSETALSLEAGEAFDIDIVADLQGVTILGWGLDLDFDFTVLQVAAPPTIAAPWTPVAAPDGDGLGGFGPIGGVSGGPVVLATLHLEVLPFPPSGASPLSVSVTPGDLTEGFPLDAPPGAFATFSVTPATATVPEPATALLMLVLAAGLWLVGRPRAWLMAALLLFPSAAGAEIEVTCGEATITLRPLQRSNGSAVRSIDAVSSDANVIVEWPLEFSRDDGFTTPSSTPIGAAGVAASGAIYFSSSPAFWDPANGVQDAPIPEGYKSGYGSTLSGDGRVGGGFAAYDAEFCSVRPLARTSSHAALWDKGGAATVLSTQSTADGAAAAVIEAVRTDSDYGVPARIDSTDVELTAQVMDLSADGRVAVGVATENHFAAMTRNWCSNAPETWCEVEQDCPNPNPPWVFHCQKRAGPCDQVASLRQPARWVNGAFEPIPTFPFTPPAVCSWAPGEVTLGNGQAVATSDDGSVVAGWSWLTCGGGYGYATAFRWTQGEGTVALDPIADTHGHKPTGMSAAGDVIVGNLVLGGDLRDDRCPGRCPTVEEAFIWDATNGMRFLRDALEDDYGANLTGWHIHRVEVLREGIHGMLLVGFAYRPDGEKIAFWTDLPCSDPDRDGLCSSWETAEGIDLDGDGIILPGVDVLLPDADPNYKDLYIEIDAMAGAGLPVSDLDPVILAFNNVPPALVPNPDGTGGIELHPIIDEVGIPSADHQPFLGLSCDPAVGMSEVDQIVGLRFGTALERQTPGVVEAKKKAYRYALISPTMEAGEIGQGLIGGPIMVMSPRSTPKKNAILFMHELGHLLGLRHGGFENTNYKPNYKSLMNYTWQWPGSKPAAPDPMALKAYRNSWRLDYSRVAYPVLFEGGLVEAAGIGGDPRSFVPVGPFLPRIAPEVGPFDFDANGQIGPGLAMANLNWIIGNQDPGSSSQVLLGHGDWPYIAENLCTAYTGPDFEFQWKPSCGASASSAAPGNPGAAEIPEEITQEIRDALGSIDWIDCNQNGVVDDDDLAAGLDTDANDNGVLDGCEPVPGDVDGDDDVDADDRDLLMAAFGRGEGEPEFQYLADLDRDQWVTFVDLQLWQAAYDEFLAGSSSSSSGATPAPACGLLGIEAALVLLACARRRRGASQASA